MTAGSVGRCDAHLWLKLKLKRLCMNGNGWRVLRHFEHADK